MDRDVAPCVLAQYAVRHRVQHVTSGANIRDGELTLLIAANPELVMPGIGLPVNLTRLGRASRATCGRSVRRMRESHEEVRRLRAWHLWVAERYLPMHRTALALVRVIDACHPVVW